jgi:DNA-binding NtrC family response regulator
MERTEIAERSEASPARKNLPVCILDDDEGLLALFREYVERMGFPVFATADPHEALEQVRGNECRVVVSDLKMPAMDGLEFLKKAQAINPDVDVILVTGHYSVDTAIDAIRRGAYDYLCKPLDRARLEKTLDELAGICNRERQVHELEQRLLDNVEFQGIVGRGPAMLEVFEMIQKVAKHYTNVLVCGPTGSGKELVARALHAVSPVAAQRFAVCNCSALVDTLLESQLFGHVRGAFTGATETRAGLFEYASGGTVFLDEIGEISKPLQSKLLRVLQNREIQRVGSPEVKHVDVRVIAATNRDLRTEVLAGRFREDLFYRLSMIQIRVPGLAERSEDIPILTQHFLKKCNEAYNKQVRGLTRRAQNLLMRHGWPGNVRELENVISAACMTTQNALLDVTDFPAHMQNPTAAVAFGDASEGWKPLPLDEVRRQHIQRVLEMCKGNRVRAAELLGIGRTSLYRFLKRENSAA